MTKSIAEIMGSKDYSRPNELNKINDYLNSNYKERFTLKLNNKNLIIVVPNASMAANIRLRTMELQKIVQDRFKVIVRIG